MDASHARIVKLSPVNHHPHPPPLYHNKIKNHDAKLRSQELEVRMQGRGSTTRLQKDALLEEALVLDSV